MSNSISRIKKFFWLISGSEISILKKYPTDHNRHMNIGLAIFTTTLIAFIAGCLAGFKFGRQNLTSALIFGLIWSMLVFTIDRNMVGTLQKNPNKSNNKKLYWAVAYRAFLSLLIAFFIAIPLELWIFKEEINKQMKKDNDTEILKQRNIDKSIYNISYLKNYSQKISSEQAKLDSLINRKNPPPGYKNYAAVESKMNSAKSYYYNLQKKYYKRVNLRQKYYNLAPQYFDSTQQKMVKLPNTEYYKKYYAIWLKTNKSGIETKILRRARKSYMQLKQKIYNIENDYFNKISAEKNRTDSLYTAKNNELLLSADSVKVKTIEHKNFVTSQNGFIKQWVALNNVSQFWVVFFIWFIRIVFFIIEMLPTLTKVLTPVGPYDINFFYQTKKAESNAEHELELLKKLQEKKLELAVENQAKVEQHRLSHELKLQEKILESLSEKQNNIAKSIIDDWEKQQKESASQDLTDFMRNKS